MKWKKINVRDMFAASNGANVLHLVLVFYFSRKIFNNCSWYLALLLKRKTTDFFNLGKMFKIPTVKICLLPHWY